eukprot:5585974-Pleurochrysis_carterae.AAC.1
MLNVALITAALILGVQRALLDPGVRCAFRLHAATICASSALIVCSCAFILAVAPTANLISKWCLSAWRAQANAARR